MGLVLLVLLLVFRVLGVRGGSEGRGVRGGSEGRDVERLNRVMLSVALAGRVVSGTLLLLLLLLLWLWLWLYR
jgi:hypothetical protein